MSEEPDRPKRPLFGIEEVEDAGSPVRAPAAANPISVEEVDDARPITAEEPEQPSPPLLPVRAQEPNWRVPAVLAASLGLVVVAAAADWIASLVAARSVLAIPAAVGMVAAVGTASWLTWREIRSLRRLRDADEFRAVLSADMGGQRGCGEMLKGIRHWSRGLEAPQKAMVSLFLSDVTVDMSSEHIRRGLDSSVLFPSDNCAVDAVHRAAYDMFFLALVSPTPLTDTAVFAARGMRMISEVASCYGARPGRLARLRIAQRALADVALVSATTIAAGAAARGVGDVLKDIGTNMARVGAASGDPMSAVSGLVVGAAVSGAGAVTERAGGEIAGALMASFRIAQIGLLVMNTTRPLALEPSRQALLAGELRRRVLTFRRQIATAHSPAVA